MGVRAVGETLHHLALNFANFAADDVRITYDIGQLIATIAIETHSFVIALAYLSWNTAIVTHNRCFLSHLISVRTLLL